MISYSEEDICRSWKNVDFTKPLVSICCITFNQEKYVRETIEGFLMQKTDFPFEIIIHDDASTDNTSDIINEYYLKYPNIIHPILQNENQYSKGNHSILATFVYPKARGKYIALCEGDDYWIKKNKLQLQADFLENNNDYVMCYTMMKMYLQEKERFSFIIGGRKTKSYEDLFLSGSKINTLTSFFRKDVLQDYLSVVHPENKGWLMGDLPMWLFFTKNNKIKFIPKITGVYRVLKESASHSSNQEKNKRFNQSSKDIRFFYSNLYKDVSLFQIYENKFLFNEAIEKKNKKDAMFYWNKLPRIVKKCKKICISYLKLILFNK